MIYPIHVVCPACGSKKFEACTRPDGTYRDHHETRKKLAYALRVERAEKEKKP